MPNLKEIPISRIAPSGRAAIAGPSRYYGYDMRRAARGEEQARATVGRGIQQIGMGILGLGQELSRKLTDDQYLGAMVEHNTGVHKFFTDIDSKRWVEDGIPQWDKIPEEFNRQWKSLTEGISSRLGPDAKELYEKYALKQKMLIPNVLTGKIEGLRASYLSKTGPLAVSRMGRSGLIEQGNDLRNLLKKSGAFPESQFDTLDKVFDKSIVLGAIGHRLPPEQIERLIKESDSLTQQEKSSLRRSAEGAIANRQREQQAALKVKQDQTSRDMLLRLWGNELTENEIEIALANNWIDETRAKSLRVSVLDPKIPKTDYLKSYENVNNAISDFREDRKTKQESLDVLYSNLKNLSRDDGEQLLNRIEEIANPDSPMNRSDVKRWLGFLNDLERFEVEQAKSDDADIEIIRDLRIKWNKKEDEFERWIKSQEKLTDKDIQSKIEQMTKIPTEEAVITWFERWVQSPFGVGYRKIAGIEKKTKEEKSPYSEYPDAFKENGVWKVIRDGKTYRIE